MSPQEQLLRQHSFSPKDIARLHEIPVRSVLAAIHSGDLPAMHVNRKVIRVTRDDLLAWGEKCRARAATMQTR